MKPIYLSISGLYSYQEKQEIYFDKLSAAGIFGIFGQVGSGKSTILEAISLALYGQSHRLNQRDNAHYNLMNLQSNRLEVIFEFEMPNAKQYRCIYEATRNSKRFEDVQKKPHRFFIKTLDNTYQPLPDGEDVEKLLGMNKDNFHRTVVIPQGKFAEFLQLGALERTKMMQDLFGLEKFDLADATKKLQTETNNKLLICNGQLANYEHVTHAHLKTALLALDKLKQTLAFDEQNQKQLQKQLIGLEKRYEVYQKIAISIKLIDELSQKTEQLPALEQTLKQLNHWQEIFKLPLYELQTTRPNVENLAKTLNDTAVNLNKAQKAFDDAINQQSMLESNAETIKQESNNLHDYEIGIALLKIQKQLITDNQRLIKGEQTVANQINAIDEKKKELEAEKEKLKKLDLKRIQIDAAIEWQVWTTNHQKLMHEANTLTQKQHQATLEIAKALKNWEEIAPKSLHHIKDSQQFEEWKTTQLAQNEPKKVMLLNKQKKASLEDELINYAKHLHNGTPCPLCGAIEHPSPLKNSTNLALHAAIESLKNELDSQEQELNKLTKAFYAYEKALSLANEKQQTHQDALIALQVAIEQSKKAKPTKWAQLTLSETVLPQLATEKEQLETDLSSGKKKCEQLETAIATDEQNLNKYRSEIEKIKLNCTTHQTKIESESKRLKNHGLSQILDIQSIEELEKRVQNIQKLINNYQFEVEQNKKACISTREVLIVTQNSFDNCTSQHKSSQNKLRQIEEQIANLLALYGIENEQHLIIALKNLPTIEKQVQSLSNDKEKLQAEHVKLSTLQNMAGEPVEESEISTIKLNLNNLNQTLNTLRTQIGAQENELKQLQTQLSQKETLEKEAQALGDRTADLNTLLRLFQGKGFVNYVSSIYLKQLVFEANKRFLALSHNQFELHLNSENGFELIDHLNGGKTRSVKTLSGGQTFQVSFSLAVALADLSQAHHGNKQSFFFMDEGFGALDAEALQHIMLALKQLKSENRIVGLITHVDRLQEELSNFLRIELTEQGGTKIHNSWD